MLQLRCVVFFLTAAGLALGGQEVHKLQAPTVKMADKEVSLPLSFYGGRPVVEARVHGKGPYRFYFDTGASGPVVSQQLTKELGLKVLGEVGIQSGGDGPEKGAIPGQLVSFDSVDFGPMQLADLRIVAMDRARLGGDEAPVGVFSPAMFPGYLVTIDYPKKALRLRPGKLGEPDNKTIFAYQPGRPIPSVIMRVGGEEIETHLDSGSGAELTLPVRYAQVLPLDGKAVETKKKARSVSGEFPVLEGQLKGSFTFGKFKIDNPKIEFSDVVRRGNLGSAFLNRFAVTLDVANRRFGLEEISP
jgi:hypothetical protein